MPAVTFSNLKLAPYQKIAAKVMLKSIISKHSEVKRDGAATIKKMKALIAAVKKSGEEPAKIKAALKTIESQKKQFEKLLEKGLSNSTKNIAKYRLLIAK